MKTLLIIDGNAMVHRAYHALPPLTKKGKAVNAVYGFFSMLLKVMEEKKPEYLIICFDRAAPTFRKLLFAGYQAHRPEMEDDLSGQFVLLHETLEKIGVQLFEVDGYEADDLIGTLAVQAVHSFADSTQEGISVKIVTGDRDLLQLVNNHVHLLMPIVGITTMNEFGQQQVEEKYGVKASQFVDYKALIGDSSDGYPGVSGIGPKTASSLIQQFDSFENIYQHLRDVSPKIAEKLATDAEQAALAKKLATIVTDAPITLDLKTCAVARLDKETIAEVFEELTFESLKKRLLTMKVIQTKNQKAGEQMGLL